MSHISTNSAKAVNGHLHAALGMKANGNTFCVLLWWADALATSDVDRSAGHMGTAEMNVRQISFRLDVRQR